MNATDRGVTPEQGGQVIGSQDARGAMKTGHMRWVLAISVVLAAAVLLGAWLWYPRAPSMSPGSEAPSAAPASTGATTSPRATPNPTAP